MVKKALIYNPYFDTLGGGEYYCLQIIKFLIRENFQVEIAWFQNQIISKINKRFGIDLKNLVTINKKAFLVLSAKRNLLPKISFESKYQLIFYVSDGSIPFLFGKQNWLLFQAPFHHVSGRSWQSQLKLNNIDKAICYSNYVKEIIDKEFNVCAQVVPPPLNQALYKREGIKKENIILSVGRFDEKLNSKKQDVLIKIFKKMVDSGVRNWQLVLIGGVIKKDNFYLKKLKKMSQGYPIKILINVDFMILKKYYQLSKIYWHSAGFGENLTLHPEKAEHFGISIIEAIASNAIPLAFKGGGVIEIINNPDYLWEKEEELISKTKAIIKSKKIRGAMGEDLRRQQGIFSIINFEKQLKKQL